KVNELNKAAKSGQSYDNETSQWLAQIGDKLYNKLADVGLVKPRGGQLGGFLESYVVGRKDIKTRTRINLNACKARLIEYFKADRDLRSITPADADGWLVFLRGRYAPATIGRTVKRARQF